MIVSEALARGRATLIGTLGSWGAAQDKVAVGSRDSEMIRNSTYLTVREDQPWVSVDPESGESQWRCSIKTGGSWYKFNRAPCIGLLQNQFFPYSTVRVGKPSLLIWVELYDFISQCKSVIFIWTASHWAKNGSGESVIFFRFIFICVLGCTCTWVWLFVESRTFRSLVLEFLVPAKCSPWVLGTQLRLSARAVPPLIVEPSL